MPDNARNFRLTNGWIWLLMIVLLAALVVGLEQIALTPIQTGDAYPAFSSLRSDPQGARALYESLAGLPGVRVERAYKDIKTLDGADDTMLVLGVDPGEFANSSIDTLKEFEKLVENGGRVVIGFKPVYGYWVSPVRPPPDHPLQDARSVAMVTAKWSVTFRYRPSGDALNSGMLGSGMPTKTALYFEPHGLSEAANEKAEEWETIARDSSGGAAETVARKFGKGTIVLAADTFGLSNEGLRDKPESQAIAALIGPAHHVIFDETHLGVSESGSVTGLMRRYGMQGAIGVLILVAALFLWRSASSLLPARATDPIEGASRNAIAGRDALEGLTALLHRGVQKNDLLDTCFAEWSKSARLSSRESSRGALIKQAMDEELARTGDAAGAYRVACRILTERAGSTSLKVQPVIGSRADSARETARAGIARETARGDSA